MLKLTKEIEEKIRKAGAEAYPNECCGILFGSEADGGHIVNALKPIDNARESSRRWVETAELNFKAYLICIFYYQFSKLQCFMSIPLHFLFIKL